MSAGTAAKREEGVLTRRGVVPVIQQEKTCNIY